MMARARKTVVQEVADVSANAMGRARSAAPMVLRRRAARVMDGGSGTMGLATASTDRKAVTRDRVVVGPTGHHPAALAVQDQGQACRVAGA